MHHHAKIEFGEKKMLTKLLWGLGEEEEAYAARADPV